MKCAGKNREGNPCGKNAMRGREFCKTHGGSKPRGPAHPGFRHGRRSKHLPTNLAAKFKQAMEDPTLLEYREQIALLSARRWAVLEAGESQLLWARAVATFNELEGAIKSGDKALMNASLLALRDLTHRGHDDSLRWREVYDLIEREGRTKEREHKRLAQMEAMISAEQFLAFVGLIVNVITQNVKDKDVLRSIARSIDALWISQGIGATNTVH